MKLSKQSLSRPAAVLGMAAVLAGGIAGCSTAAPAPGGSGATAVVQPVAEKSHTLTFEADDMEGNMVVVDLGAPSTGGPDLGDMVSFTQNLSQDGKVVGQVHVSSVVVDHEKKLSESNATMVVDGGTIQLAGLVSMDPEFTLTITGGTGAYLGATGVMEFDGSGPAQLMKVTLAGK